MARQSRTAFRVAASISAIWVIAAFFLSEEQERFRWFLLLGVLPVLVAWTIRWVLVSHQRDKRDATRSGRLRFPPWK